MRRLRVAIGAVAGVTGGPATYAIESARALAALGDEGLALSVLTDAPEAFSKIAGLEVIPVPLSSPWAQPWWDNVAVPKVLRRERFDVYHGTKHALPLIGYPPSTRRVVTIHDLAVYAEPQTFSRAQRMQLHLHLRHAARTAHRIVCVSEHAASDVVLRLGVARERITVIPHGIGSLFQPPADPERRSALRERWSVGEDGFLVTYVGTAQPRKRIDVAVEAIGRLVAQGLAVTFVVAGRRRPGFEPSWLRDPPPYVRLLGEIGDHDLVDLLGASDVMVSPSSYEGFGLTFAEAMACGTPVVGVGVTSVPEVVGDGGLLVDAPEAGAVADALGQLLRDPGLRAAKAAAALQQAGRFSWERAARAAAEAYRVAAAA